MLSRVLARAPLPTSAPASRLSSITAAQAKTLKASGVSVDFTTPKQLGQNSAVKDKAPMGFSGKRGEVDVMANTTKGSSNSTTCAQLIAGLGSGSSVRDYRLAITNSVRKAQAMGASAVTIRPPSTDVLTAADVFHPARPLMKQEVVEKTTSYAIAAAYEYNRLKTQQQQQQQQGATSQPTASSSSSRRKTAAKGKKSTSAADKANPFNIFIDSNDTIAIRTGGVIGNCINDARNLGNLREDEGTPAFYVEWAKKHVIPEGVKLRKVLRGEQIREAGLNLLYNVGKGSSHEPYVLILEYVGNKRSSHATALVGKGVTFDCGGHNIKPYGSMETMHTDMMGAATVLSTMKAVAQMDLPINLVGAVGLVENAIGPDSYFPSSILTSLKGLTVEVLNTDAEGRLVLADVLTYVQKHAKLEKSPSTIIDLATLTGAVMIALGSRRAGLFSNSARLSEKLMATGTQSGEELWPLPVGEEHVEAMKGGIADLVNAGAGRQAGACTAAAFLSNFIEPGREWAHLDIAGTADVGDKKKGFHPAGVTGYGVQLLVDYLRRK